MEKVLHKPYLKAAREGRLKAVVTVSESTRRDLVELGYPEQAIKIVYNGVDWDYYRDCPSLGDERGCMVLYLGRITKYKGIEDLLLAWKIVEKRVKDARLVIAGRLDYGYLKRLESLASRLRLERVVFKPNVSSREKKSYSPTPRS